MMLKILQVFLFVVTVFRCRSFILREVDILIDIDEILETDINNKPDIDETLETDINNKPDIDETLENDINNKPDIDETLETDINNKPDIDETLETDINNKPDIDETLETGINNKPDIIILDNYPDDLEPELDKTNCNDDVYTDDSDDIDPNLDLEIYDDEKMNSSPVAFSKRESDEPSLEAVQPTCQCLPSGESCTIKIKSKTVNITVSRNETTYVPRLIVKLNYSEESWTQYFTVMQTPDVSHTFRDNVEISVQVGFKGLGEVCLYLSKPFITKLGCCKLLGSETIYADNSEPEVNSDLDISHLDKIESEIVNGSKPSPMDHKVMDFASHKEAKSDSTLRFQSVIIN